MRRLGRLVENIQVPDENSQMGCVANRAAAVVTVVPLTSSVEQVYPFEVLLGASATGLSKDSKAMAQQVRTVDKARLNARAAGAVQADDMRRLDAALRLHLGL